MEALTDRQRRVLGLLLDEGDAGRLYTYPARVARMLDGPGRSGAGWRQTLDALERRDLVKGTYAGSGTGGRSFALTTKGFEVLNG